MNAIEINQLTKIFPPQKTAVDHISLSVEKGAVFGFLGPNGAGKTTTVKLLTGMLGADSGSASVLGLDPAGDSVEIHAKSGVVTEHAGMYDTLTGIQNLTFFGEVFGLDKDAGRSRGMERLGQLDLTDAADKKLGTYSTGMRQRLSLARALMHRPEVLFLDEPTSGLDPESTKNVNELIRTLAEDSGTTVFLCTHQLRYAQEICTSYGLIDNGRLLACGDLEYLRSLVFAGHKVRFKTNIFPAHIPHQKLGPNEYEASLDSEEQIPDVIREIVKAGGDIYHVSSRRLSLEDIYFALIENQRKGGALA